MKNQIEAMKMDDKYAALIQKLADKFGTTAEHLYGVLVVQAKISAFTDLIVSAILVAITIWLFRLISAKTREPKEPADSWRSQAEWKDEAAVIAWLLFGFLATITVINVLFSISSVTTALLNPEYWAIKQIIG